MPKRKPAKSRNVRVGGSRRAPSVPRTSKDQTPSGTRSGTAAAELTETRTAVCDPAPARRPQFRGLDPERETYARLKPELMKRAEGLYVVIQGEEVEGPVETYGDALRVGYRRFGVDRPFLVQQILAVEPAATVSRDIEPCPA